MTAIRTSRFLTFLAVLALVVSAPFWITPVLDALLLLLGALVWLIVLISEWIG